MKKYVRWITAIAVIATVIAAFAVGATAEEPIQEGGHWVINAEKIDEILAGEAGEKTTGWEVPFLQVSPTLDGKISKAEYQPFELYEDYLSYMAIIGNATQGNTKEEFMEFYEMTKDGFFDAYWGWDGRYLYVAFEVRCVNGFKCTPEEMGGNVYLYAYNMMQLGIAPVDATGKDPDYVELGFGVHSETGESLTHTWAGPYYPVAGEDFVGSYDKENQTVVYEARIHLQTALGLTDRTVENGDEINFAWLLSVNGATSSVYDYWQVGFCHGIGGQYSNKQNQYFARVTFAGKDITIDPEEIAGISEEDKLYELVEYVDMSDEATVKTFTGEDAAIDYVTEDGESFARITSLGDLPYVWSSKYPRNLQSADCSYIVVKYRTSSAKAEEMAILYRNAYFPDYDLENAYSETLDCSGEWRTVIFYMFGEDNWQNWIVNMGLAPFYDADETAGQTIDIAFVKFYNQDPSDLYTNEDVSGGEEEPTETDTEVDTLVEEDITAAVEEDTTVSADTTPDTTAEAVTDGDDATGCASSVGLGLVALCAVGTAAIVFKKKED